MEDKKPRPILKKLKTLIQGDNSNRVKKNASGGKTYKSRGKGTDGSSLRSKLKTRGENGEITSLSVKREKGLFGGKKKTRVSAKPVEMLSEKGSAFGMNVKKKTITKAPGILGKRTVKRETKFVESPKSKMEGSYESAQEKPQYLAQGKLKNTAKLLAPTAILGGSGRAKKPKSPKTTGTIKRVDRDMNGKVIREYPTERLKTKSISKKEYDK
jgi:hypothetical protein